jgi:hypothetical protein
MTQFHAGFRLALLRLAGMRAGLLLATAMLLTWPMWAEAGDADGASPAAASNSGATVASRSVGSTGAPSSSNPRSSLPQVCDVSMTGSPFLPIDSWVYPAVLRLYSMGYIETVYLGMRPWTRANLRHMLDSTGPIIEEADEFSEATVSEARQIYKALEAEADSEDGCQADAGGAGPAHARAWEMPWAHARLQPESAYSITRGLSGTPLRDSYHLGSTLINDFARPYERGFNNYTGASGYLSAGRFVVYVRGEFDGAPSAAGYSQALAQTLTVIDGTIYTDPATGLPVYFPQETIPLGPIATATEGRLLEAYASATLLNHVFSLGKVDEWLGPGQGGAMAYSNNAENIWAFRINRVEPLQVPFLSRLTGPFRYEFLVGPLGGHTLIPSPDPVGPGDVINPGNPWVHVEKVSFRPTRNLEFGFERTVIWGGKGHEPITLHTFLRSFFSLVAPDHAVKYSPADPGARFGAFDFSYRLPLLRNWVTLYTDSEAHDSVSPISNPPFACFRPGIYLAHVPGIPKLDVRAEAAYTDPPTPKSQSGHYEYYEELQVQGYTNKGALFGDWIGREDKGGQGWITYHLSANEWIEVGVRNQKAAKDFIPGGTTLNDLSIKVVKRIRKDVELDGSFTWERWKAPVYLPGAQTVTTSSIRLTWFPASKHEK